MCCVIDDNECKYGGHDETIGAESSSRDQFLADYFQILNFMGNKELYENDLNYFSIQRKEITNNNKKS